jgi:hypothetical protein
MTTQTADAAKQARATVLSMSSDERVTDLEDQQSEAIRLVLSEVGDLAMLCRPAAGRSSFEDQRPSAGLPEAAWI